MPAPRPLIDGWMLRPFSGEVPEEVATTLSAYSGGVPATVPGCVHTDLLAAGAIPDPYLDRNEHDLAWIGRTDWRYQTQFEHRSVGHERLDLICDGLDTVATLWVGDTEVASTANQHRSYRFPIADAVSEGTR